MAQVTKKKDGVYQIRVSHGYDSKGKQITKTKTWHAPKGITKTAEKRLLDKEVVLFEEKVVGGKCVEVPKFEEFSKQWFETVANKDLKPKTVKNYRSSSEIIEPVIGHLKLDKITARVLQDLVDEMLKKYIVSSVKTHMEYVSVVLQYAYRLELIDENPCRRIHYPKFKKKEKEIFTIEEAQRFLCFAEKELPLKHYVFYLIAIYGGLRRGELAGLKWSDIDFNNNTIHVNRNACYTKELGVYTDTPKTKGSRRIVAFPYDVMETLKKYQYQQLENRLRFGDAWKGGKTLNDMWLFPKVDGQLANPGEFFHWAVSDCKKAGVKCVTPHSFRHLNASILIQSGEDIATVSACLGHSSPATTLNIYAHSFEKAQAKAAERIANVLVPEQNDFADE